MKIDSRQQETEQKLSRFWLVPLAILILLPVWFIWPRESSQDLTLVPAATTKMAIETSVAENTKTNKTGIFSEDAFHSVLTVDEREHFPVYLTGAIHLPGLYYVPDGTILAEVVAEAGGLRDDAAGDHINLAMKVLAHQMFYIPTKDELVDDPSLASLIRPLPGTPEGKVNINTADADLLVTLPGVGPATANAIIRHRETNGPFQSPADLMNVTGIKQSKYEGLEMYITAP